MAFCPACKKEWREGTTTCLACGAAIDKAEEQSWIVLGHVLDKFSADFAREVLTSYEIPNVVISRSGFFGDVGLPLNPIYKTGFSSGGAFEVSVPADQAEEAEELLAMALGDQWQPTEE